MLWFKLSRELLHDPRLGDFTRAEKYIIVQLLSLSCWDEEPGMITLSRAQIASDLDMSVAYWERFEMKLQVRRHPLIRVTKDERVLIAPWLLPYYENLPWSQEQIDSLEQVFGESETPARKRKPSDAPERVLVRVNRSRQGAKSEAVVTPPSPDCNAPSGGIATPPASRERAQEAEQAEAEPLLKEEAEAESPLIPPIIFEDNPVAEWPEPCSAPPFSASAPASALPAGEALLSKFDEQDLIKSGWSLVEIDIGCQILCERKTPAKDVKALLHASILPEVRGGRRPKQKEVKPAPKPPPPPPRSPATNSREPTPEECKASFRAALSPSLRAGLKDPELGGTGDG